MHRIRSRVIGTLAFALLLAAPGPLWPAETKSGPDQVVEGAKKVGQGVEETAKEIGTTVSEGAKKAGREAKPVGDKLHDRAKGFGEAIWDGMKYVGRTLENFFTGKK